MLKRRFGWGIAVALMSVTALAVTSVPASAANDQIMNPNIGKCLTSGGSTANSAPITQFTCNGSPNQTWTQGTVIIVAPDLLNQASGKCLTNGGSLANGAPITQFTCNQSTNQQWFVEGSEIINITSDKCLTNGGSTANGAPITQFTCNGSTNQQWELN